jgi:hypothetical protein
MAIAPAWAFYSVGKIGHRHQDAAQRDQHPEAERGGSYYRTNVHARPPQWDLISLILTLTGDSLLLSLPPMEC